MITPFYPKISLALGRRDDAAGDAPHGTPRPRPFRAVTPRAPPGAPPGASPRGRPERSPRARGRARPARRPRATPSFAHSSSRRSACAAGRSRPVRPSSPNAATLSLSGAPRAAEAIASATARSAPGSSIRTPPATFTNTSAEPSGTPPCRREHGDDHREPLRVDPRRDTPRHREVAPRDERLDLEQERARPLERDGDRRADLARLRSRRRAPTARGRRRARRRVISNTPSSFVEPNRFFVGAQDAVRVVPVALELQHAVDEVLEHPRAGDGAVLRDVADEDGRDAVLLRDAEQPRGRLAHLRDGARRRAELAGVERLHRVDHADGRPSRSRASRRRRRAPSRRGSRRRRRRRGARREGGPAPPTPPRSRAARCAPAARDRAERAEQQRGLADAGLAAEEHQRRRHEAAAQDAVELRDPRREPGRLLDADVAEALGASRRGARPPRRPCRAAPRRACRTRHSRDSGRASAPSSPRTPCR